MRFNALALFLMLHSGLMAQESSEGSPEASEAESLSSNPVPESAPQSVYKEERANLQKILSSEIIPNLPAADVEKLQRSVQRLGSYRAEWAKSAQELLIANAPVAELMLYKFSAYQNPRLSFQILKTLLSFESLRFPRAALAYAEVFGVNPEAKLMSVRLLAKAVNQDLRLADEALQLLSTSWAADISPQERLSFIVDSCPSWSKVGPQTQSIAAAWGDQAGDLWGRLLKVEAISCSKGI